MKLSANSGVDGGFEQVGGSAGAAAHFAQLDGLRALAVFAVFVEHWLPMWCEVFSWGRLGVRCFFVLSGFLITGILLRGRAAVEEQRSSLGWQFWGFYMRRALRIFPVYYVTLAVGCLLGMEVLRGRIWWEVAYLSNVKTALEGVWPGYVSHLWSLAVEEQFYLVWPAVVLLVPRRWLGWVLGGTVVLGVVSRAVLAVLWGSEELGVYVLMPCCVDALGMGAVLAWGMEQGAGRRAQGGSAAESSSVPSSSSSTSSSFVLEKLSLACAEVFEDEGRGRGSRGRRSSMAAPSALLIGLLGMGVCFFVFPVASVGYRVLEPWFEGVLCVGVVWGAVRGFSGWVGRALSGGFLAWSGRVSYGLYLFHLFAAYMLGMICDKLGLARPTELWVLVPLYLAMTYAGAGLSWWGLERWCNGLKRYFPAVKKLRSEKGKVKSEKGGGCGVELEFLKVQSGA